MPDKSNINGNNDFKMKTAEWRGYTIKALEDIDREIKDIKREIKHLDKNIDLLNEKITLMRIKVAGYGGAVGLVTALIVSLFLK
jgi:hypothetical protein